MAYLTFFALYINELKVIVRLYVDLVICKVLGRPLVIPGTTRSLRTRRAAGKRRCEVADAAGSRDDELSQSPRGAATASIVE
jgi:hypothetical protein